ncbi:MAG: hypothetical protein N4A33_00805 [Bacteriovoracaceae bacterium]|jgi:hypothetical protein|nr:hypothetical protein [Bacteriovoracaceae bacterium]
MKTLYISLLCCLLFSCSGKKTNPVELSLDLSQFAFTANMTPDIHIVAKGIQGNNTMSVKSRIIRSHEPRVTLDLDLEYTWDIHAIAWERVDLTGTLEAPSFFHDSSSPSKIKCGQILGFNPSEMDALSLPISDSACDSYALRDIKGDDPINYDPSKDVLPEIKDIDGNFTDFYTNLSSRCPNTSGNYCYVKLEIFNKDFSLGGSSNANLVRDPLFSPCFKFQVDTTVGSEQLSFSSLPIYRVSNSTQVNLSISPYNLVHSNFLFPTSGLNLPSGMDLRKSHLYVGNNSPGLRCLGLNTTSILGSDYFIY